MTDISNSRQADVFLLLLGHTVIFRYFSPHSCIWIETRSVIFGSFAISPNQK